MLNSNISHFKLAYGSAGVPMPLHTEEPPAHLNESDLAENNKTNGNRHHYSINLLHLLIWYHKLLGYIAPSIYQEAIDINKDNIYIRIRNGRSLTHLLTIHENQSPCGLRVP